MYLTEYQAFIYSVPILFTLVLLLLFYWIYLRRPRVTVDLQLGLKKELREMLRIIVFNQSFTVKDTQCCVCLGDYQAKDRLQQIPSCGHTFHMDCIDHWLATHTTCPLCRHSLLVVASSKCDNIRRASGGGDPQTSQQSANEVACATDGEL